VLPSIGKEGRKNVVASCLAHCHPWSQAVTDEGSWFLSSMALSGTATRLAADITQKLG